MPCDNLQPVENPFPAVAPALPPAWPEKVRAFLASPMMRQAGQMIASRGVGLVVAAAGSIWAARCLGPEKLGVSGMVLAFVAPLGLLIDLNQDVSLIRHFKQCADDDERRRLVARTFAFRALLALAWLLLAAGALAIFGLPGASWQLAVIAAFPLLLVTANQSVWVLQAQENMPARYRALLWQSLIGAGGYFLFFRPGRMPTGADVIVMACAVAADFFIGWWYVRRALWAGVARAAAPLRERWSDFCAGLRRMGGLYWEGRWLAIGGLVTYLYVFFQMPLVGTILGSEALGQYRTAHLLVNGLQAFAVMIPALLYPRMIDWHRIGAEYLWQRQCQFLRTALIFFVPAVLAAFLLAPLLYRTLFGPQFLPAAYPFAVLVLSKMTVVLNGIFAWGLSAQHRDRLMLSLTTGTAVVSLSLNFWLLPTAGILGAAMVCALAEFLMLAATLTASWLLVRQARQRHAAATTTTPS